MIAWASSAPMPVSDRASISRYERSAPCSLLSIVPSQQPRNPIGTLMIAVWERLITGPSITFGPRKITASEAEPGSRPDHRAHDVEAPAAQRQQQRREVRARRDGERERHQDGDVRPRADDDPARSR